MSKYNTLWAYIHESDKPQLTLNFDEIRNRCDMFT